MIEWIDSAAGIKVPTRDGRILCSSRDPIREAQKWVDSLPKNLVGPVTIIGLGGGFHIQALLAKGLKINVIEFDHELVLHFFDQNPELAKQITWMTTPKEIEEVFWQTAGEIFFFRPAIQGRETDYLDVYSDLVRRDIGVVEFLNTQGNAEEQNLLQILSETVSVPGER